jgi:predicted AlkP superfamily pyrophosphatase or phosphodiesterase
MGYLEHLIEYKKGAKFKIKSELPAMSRPMYETILTGTPVLEHSIVNNSTSKLSKESSIFSLCRENKLKTAAAAYHWISELYNKTPFDITEDRVQLNTDKNIENGIFYYEDSYPDNHLFNDAEFLRKNFNPDFLFIHSMNIDDVGHKFGNQSLEYAKAVSKADTILSMYLPKWIEQDYNIIITSDHGMNENKIHGGNSEIQRMVPLYIFANDKNNIKKGEFTENEISQLSIAPLTCKLLGINKSRKMKELNKYWSGIFEK